MLRTESGEIGKRRFCVHPARKEFRAQFLRVLIGWAFDVPTLARLGLASQPLACSGLRVLEFCAKPQPDSKALMEGPMEGHHNLEASDPRFVRHLEIYKYGIRHLPGTLQSHGL